MSDFQQTSKEIAALSTFHRTLRDRRLADRIKAIISLGTGWSVSEVAQILLYDETTIYNWIEKYQSGGKEELLTLCYKGKACSLTEHQQEELAKHLDEKTYLASKDIRDYVKKKYKVKYSATGMKELLHRLGFSYKKPTHVPGKLDPVKQEAFVEEYEILRKTKGRNDPIYFADACHPQHNSIPAYGWIRRGKAKLLLCNY
jgi:transposase